MFLEQITIEDLIYIKHKIRNDFNELGKNDPNYKYYADLLIKRAERFGLKELSVDMKNDL